MYWIVWVPRLIFRLLAYFIVAGWLLLYVVIRGINALLGRPEAERSMNSLADIRAEMAKRFDTLPQGVRVAIGSAGLVILVLILIVAGRSGGSDLPPVPAGRSDADVQAAVCASNRSLAEDIAQYDPDGKTVDQVMAEMFSECADLPTTPTTATVP